jgi:formate hydrogenlyase subunit 3/multisubunit Na+/H+ antiporter MnhD subunit
MQSGLPFWVYLGSMLCWLISALFISKKSQSASVALVMFFAVIQLFASIWGAVSVFRQELPISLGHSWFKLGGLQEVAIQLELEPTTAVLWELLSLFSAFFAFFNLFGKSTDQEATGRQLSIFPFLSVTVWLALCSANLVTFYVGWFASAFAGFLSLVVDSAGIERVSAPRFSVKDEQAVAAKRYATLNVIAALLFAAGLIGIYYDFQTFSFTEIASKASAPSFHFILFLVFATFLRGMQLPFREMFRYAGASQFSVVSVGVFSHLFVAPLIFIKMYPQLISAYEIHDLALIPSLTGIIAAIDLISEKNEARIISGLIVILTSFVLTFGLLGNYQVAMATLVAGSTTVLFFSWALLLSDSMSQLKKFLFGFAALSFSGVPFGSWGWAQLLQYTGLLTLQTAFAGLSWVLLALKLTTDILLGLFLWKCFWASWFLSKDNNERAGRSFTKAKPTDVFVGLTLFAMSTFAVSIGGRPFGGLLGESGLELFRGWVWFENIFVVKGNSSFIQKSAMEFLGSNEDFFARGLSMGAFLIPTLIAGLWLFRDLASIEDFTDRATAFSRAVKGPFKGKSLLWDFCFLPISKFTSHLVRLVESIVFEEWIERATGFLEQRMKKAAGFIETTVLDSILIDGTAKVVLRGSQLIRSIHNGRAQFYMGLGLILFILIIIRFIY